MVEERSTEPFLHASDISTGYGDIQVLWNVSLEARPGEVTAVLGRNGAGKTSLLRAIAGLNRVSTGWIELDGRRIDRVPPYRRVGLGIAYVQEGKRIFRQRTVEENLMLGGYSIREPRRELMKRIEEAYERFPILGSRKSERAANLSGGQQQMLLIAQAIVSRPKFILLDEPSAGLAPAIIGDVLEAVRDLRDEGHGVLLVEQSVDFALAVASDVTVLDLGRVAYTGRSDEAGIKKKIEDAYFGVAVSTSSTGSGEE